MDKIRVFIIDDSIIARSMLVRLLSDEDDIEIAGEAGTGQGGILMLEEIKPDVVMLEAAVSGGMALDAVIKEIKQINPETQVIVCAEPNTGTNARMILASRAGADDFITKPYKKTSILRVIRESME